MYILKKNTVFMIHTYSNNNYKSINEVKNELKIGDMVTCVEDRHVQKIDARSGLKWYSEETIPFIKAGDEYDIVKFQKERGKLGLICGDGRLHYIQYDRLAFKVNSDL